MNILPEIAALDADMRTWRHHLHAHPETAFELPIGASYWVTLAEQQLPRTTA